MLGDAVAVQDTVGRWERVVVRAGQAHPLEAVQSAVKRDQLLGIRDWVAWGTLLAVEVETDATLKGILSQAGLWLGSHRSTHVVSTKACMVVDEGTVHRRTEIPS